MPGQRALTHGTKKSGPCFQGPLKIWRRGSGSNRRKRLCRPLHNHFATPPRVHIVTVNAKLCRLVHAMLMRLLSSTKILLIKKRKLFRASLFWNCGAGEESRTLDLNLGKVALYQLSYSRVMQKQKYKPAQEFVNRN